MKVFALTLLSLLALSQARVDYNLQCTRSEISIRWPSYHSNSEYFVCEGVYGKQLTVHCPAGQVFTFVLQQCVPPAHYIPAPPMDVLPTAAPVTMQVIDDGPPVIFGHPQVEETHETHEHHHEHHENHHEHHEAEAEVHPIPPTPAPEPPTLSPVEIVKPVVPVPQKKPTVPVPTKKPTAPVPSKASKKPAATAKKPPTPAKAAKKPTPPSKVQKKPATA